jgi:Mg-chelatase subunit ChlD
VVKKVLALGPGGKLFLKSPDGKLENIPRHARASVYLLMDCSGSMSGEKLKQAKNGARSFSVDALAKGYSVGLIQFDSQAEVVCEPQTNISITEMGLDKLVIGGSTNLTESLQLARSRLEALDGVRAIVVVTDGMPDNRGTALKTAEEVKSLGITIIAIGTDDADASFLAELASQEGFGLKVPQSRLEQVVTSAAKLLPTR